MDGGCVGTESVNIPYQVSFGLGLQSLRRCEVDHLIVYLRYFETILQSILEDVPPASPILRTASALYSMANPRTVCISRYGDLDKIGEGETVPVRSSSHSCRPSLCGEQAGTSSVARFSFLYILSLAIRTRVSLRT